MLLLSTSRRFQMHDQRVFVIYKWRSGSNLTSARKVSYNARADMILASFLCLQGVIFYTALHYHSFTFYFFSVIERDNCRL